MSYFPDKIDHIVRRLNDNVETIFLVKFLFLTKHTLLGRSYQVKKMDIEDGDQLQHINEYELLIIIGVATIYEKTYLRTHLNRNNGNILTQF